MRFLRNFVQSFNIAEDGSHVGVVLFSSTAEVVFNFEKYFDSNSIIDAIDKISYPSKSTYTGKGLDLVRTGLFEISERQGVRDVLIVMTDGASQVRVFDNKIVSKVIMFLNMQPPPKKKRKRKTPVNFLKTTNTNFM